MPTDSKKLDCASTPYQQATDKCAIPIKHETRVPASFREYPDWSVGDNYLDFGGAEVKQGLFNGRVASGTPLVWSTDDRSQPAYQPYNKYGPGYWLVELSMDCSRTEDGWFEVKGFLAPSSGWERSVSQGYCRGIGISAPFQSTYHIAKCGAVNVFLWGSNDCFIDTL
ncbi:hypothetical protein OESDEN_07691 [Oesophagostomum dentatum]|uniref:Uncharacterized protein n=1 Tax=Oesophagostomum dentatum TaxID=61180 RepID=A0A0B1TAL5_OESDE|nr:hypothetical protein OESDEN_07691 [Oesophagostomum dentatum]